MFVKGLREYSRNRKYRRKTYTDRNLIRKGTLGVFIGHI
ncbi:hypothetical protein LEP1GSC066_0548 [Leptospira sp. serovar Kenya str. Sh9]|nr:hypothetical protein LEP1GSC066_0548 [Leptospira sp. serovar Kenya str. Sh9]